MIKYLLLDVDGIVIHREMYFSTRFLHDYGVPEERIQPFFQNEFKQCIVGQADLKKEIAKYLESWNWKGSIDELLNYWFEFESTTDQPLIVFVQELRAKNVHCYLQTQNEKYRTQYIWENVGLQNSFDGVFSSANIGAKKATKEFWEKVYERLNKPEKNEGMVWDDDEEVVQAAQNFGFQASFYKDFSSFKDSLSKHLS